MSTSSDGGPAFPIFSDYAQAPGMTLRDYFAAAALEGMLADESRAFPCHEYAADAYALADAMLKQRAKTKEDQQ